LTGALRRGGRATASPDAVSHTGVQGTCRGAAIMGGNGNVLRLLPATLPG
jgi:hypothetical protein